MQQVMSQSVCVMCVMVLTLTGRLVPQCCHSQLSHPLSRLTGRPRVDWRLGSQSHRPPPSLLPPPSGRHCPPHWDTWCRQVSSFLHDTRRAWSSGQRRRQIIHCHHQLPPFPSLPSHPQVSQAFTGLTWLFIINTNTKTDFLNIFFLFSFPLQNVFNNHGMKRLVISVIHLWVEALLMGMFGLIQNF